MNQYKPWQTVRQAWFDIQKLYRSSNVNTKSGQDWAIWLRNWWSEKMWNGCFDNRGLEKGIISRQKQKQHNISISRNLRNKSTFSLQNFNFIPIGKSVWVEEIWYWASGKKKRNVQAITLTSPVWACLTIDACHLRTDVVLTTHRFTRDQA